MGTRRTRSWPSSTKTYPFSKEGPGSKQLIRSEETTCTGDCGSGMETGPVSTVAHSPLGVIVDPELTSNSAKAESRFSRALFESETNDVSK